MTADVDIKPTRVSDRWRGMTNVFAEEREQVRLLLECLDFEWLERRAGSLKGKNCTARTDIFSSGQDHVVFELSFPDSTFWVARISKPWSLKGPAEMLSEIQTVKYVSKHTTIPVPRVFEYDVNPNPLGAPYMLMEEIQGHFVHSLPRIPQQHIRHVYSQIADIVLQLSQLRFPLIGLLHEDQIQGCVFGGYERVDAFHTATDFYTFRAVHFANQCSDPDWLALAWLYIQAIPLITTPELDRGPFPLRHPDLNNANILYDDDYNIVGVLDWTAAQAAPWQSFAVPPNQFESSEFLAERQLYFEVFEEVERTHNLNVPLAVMMREVKCEITELLDNCYGWSKFPVGYATKLGRLVFGDGISWDTIKKRYEESSRVDNKRS